MADQMPAPKDEKPMSVIYSPHGVSEATLSPYVHTHLLDLSALPVTALFHSINVERNPWFMGGRVMGGLPSGMAIIKRFGARYWISAHDEDKDNRGWATAMIKSKHYTLEEAQQVLDYYFVPDMVGDGMMTKSRRKTTVLDIDVGDEAWL